MLYLLDYDLRIDEPELLTHFAPFLKMSSLVPSAGVAAAKKQQVMRGVPYSHGSSINDNSTFAVPQTRMAPPQRSEIVPITLSAVPHGNHIQRTDIVINGPARAAAAAAGGQVVDMEVPTTPDQGGRIPHFTRAVSQSIRRVITGSGASSSGSSSACSELTEDRGSSSEGSPATSDDESGHHHLQAGRSTATAKRISINGTRLFVQRSVSTNTISSKAVSMPLTPSSSAGSNAGRPTGMVKSVSYYEPKVSLVNKNGNNTWA